MEPIFIKAD